MIHRNEKETVTKERVPHQWAAQRFDLPNDSHGCDVTGQPPFHGAPIQ